MRAAFTNATIFAKLVSVTLPDASRTTATSTAQPARAGVVSTLVVVVVVTAVVVVDVVG